MARFFTERGTILGPRHVARVRQRRPSRKRTEILAPRSSSKPMLQVNNVTPSVGRMHHLHGEYGDDGDLTSKDVPRTMIVVKRG
jgi:hypothetical protein